MAETMIASDMTDGQIDDLANKLRDAARKHRNEVSKDVAQQVLGADNLGMRLFVILRQLAEAISNMIVRIVKVNRNQFPKEAINATDWASIAEEIGKKYLLNESEVNN